MKRRFWLYVRDRLEDAWHWVYYHKLAGDLPKIVPSNVEYGWQYSVSYINGKTGTMTDPSPVTKSSTENKQEG